MGKCHRFITLLAHLEGARIKQVPVKHHTRHTGVSKYGLERVFKVVADMMLLLFIRKYFPKAHTSFWNTGSLIDYARNPNKHLPFYRKIIRGRYRF